MCRFRPAAKPSRHRFHRPSPRSVPLYLFLFSLHPSRAPPRLCYFFIRRPPIFQPVRPAHVRLPRASYRSMNFNPRSSKKKPRAAHAPRPCPPSPRLRPSSPQLLPWPLIFFQASQSRALTAARRRRRDRGSFADSRTRLSRNTPG